MSTTGCVYRRSVNLAHCCYVSKEEKKNMTKLVYRAGAVLDLVPSNAIPKNRPSFFSN